MYRSKPSSRTRSLSGTVPFADCFVLFQISSYLNQIIKRNPLMKKREMIGHLRSDRSIVRLSGQRQFVKSAIMFGVDPEMMIMPEFFHHFVH